MLPNVFYSISTVHGEVGYLLLDVEDAGNNFPIYLNGESFKEVVNGGPNRLYANREKKKEREH